MTGGSVTAGAKRTGRTDAPLAAGNGPDLSTVEPLRDDLTAEYLEQQLLLPLERRDEHLLTACAEDPDPQAIAELEALFDLDVELRRVGREELLAAIRRIYGREAGTAEELISELRTGDAGESRVDLETHDLEGLANQPPVVRLVNLVLSEAVEVGASDIHLEADGSGLQVRYRIDGVLQDAPSPPSHLRAAMISRLKIMAELDIAERRLPQDGRIRLRIEDRELDVRVSTLPTLHGESVVLRLLDAERQRHALEGLGMADDTLAEVMRFAERPQGVFLATGPTGSGKTTTLYAILERIRTGREKIVSVEDPVEYELPGVAQVPAETRGGLTFARALRSILRQDPDVLLVGEMRDPETAEICTRASMTGHLVVSTLHTNDAPSAVTRLLDLGIPDYLVASTVEGVLAQRLVRRTCDRCAERTPLDAAGRRELERDGWEIASVRRGRGCAACRGTGYRGRTGIYELLVVDEEIRAEILGHRGSRSIRDMALDRGMRPLRQDGWRQVAEGVTTPEEVLRVTAA